MVVVVPFSGLRVLPGQETRLGQGIQVDSDGDGLSDVLEQGLLEQFRPSFRTGRADCSTSPAQFVPKVQDPMVKAEDGTIYGQVFPAKKKEAGVGAKVVEIHFYHLWRRDCGAHGHPLDAEHVAVLVRGEASGDGMTWKALYWYAAAHEDTVCDVSQITRASTLKAEDRGARVWISPGKHASYLNERLCRRGCGADRCEAMIDLPVARVINLGEAARPMDGALFVTSAQWPLSVKMDQTNFPAEPIGRLERLPDTEIAWFHPGRHPAQGIIAISSSTEGALAAGAANTTGSIGAAGASTSDAISVARDSTGNALSKSYHKTARALGSDAVALRPTLATMRRVAKVALRLYTGNPP